MDQTLTINNGNSIIVISVLILIVSVVFLLPLLFQNTHSNKKETQDSSSTPKPFTQWNHPYKFKTDKILSLLFPYIAPVNSLSDEPYDTSFYQLNEGKSKLERLRKRFDLIESFLHMAACFFWYRKVARTTSHSSKTVASSFKDYIVYGTVVVPRKPNILQEWKIIKPEQEDEGQHQTSNTVVEEEQKNVEIELTCLQSSFKNLDETKLSSSNDFFQCFQWRKRFNSSCQNLDAFIFQSKCPIVIYFHGGGMALGSSRDMTSIIDCAMKLPSIAQQHHNKQHEQNSMRNDNVILMSVTYRLAPEHPFPNAIIDCLSTASYVIEKYAQNHDIYIGGFSAGGNLSSVVGMECHRMYPGKVKCVMAIDPMLIPHTNTTSIRMNALSSSFCPPKFLRWCWTAYLQPRHNQLSSQTEQFINYGNVTEYKQLLMNSKWLRNEEHEDKHQKSTLSRLFYPQIDLPNSLNNESNKPLIIIRTSKADILRDDGLDFVHCLKNKGANVMHFESTGSHGISSIVHGTTGDVNI